MFDSWIIQFFLIFFLTFFSAVSWQTMLKGKGSVDNLWLFSTIITMVFTVTVSSVIYFPFVSVTFFTGTLLYLIFTALYIYSFPRSVWPNYLWAVILGSIAATGKFLYINYSQHLYIAYFFLSIAFTVIYSVIIFRKIKYLKLYRKRAVISFTSYIATAAILFAFFSGISTIDYNSLFFHLFIFIMLPVSIAGFVVAVILNINPNTGVNSSNILLFLLFSLPFTFFIRQLFYFRAVITKFIGTTHFVTGALLLLFIIICFKGIIISLVSTAVEGFISRSRSAYQKLLNEYRLKAEKTTSYKELFTLFQTTLKKEFSDIRSVKFIIVSDNYTASAFSEKDFIDLTLEFSGLIKDDRLLHEPYFTKNSINPPSEIVYLANKCGGDVFIPVVYKSEITGFIILNTRKTSHNVQICIYNMANITVNVFEKIALFSAVLETEKKLEASRHFRETGKMVSFIAHELRSPLSSIMFNMEVIKDHITKNKELDTEYLDISLKEIKRLNDIVEKMLAYGRDIKLSPSEDSVSSFFEELAHLYQKTESSVKFVDRTKNRTFNFDWNALKSVLINLITNSLQAIERKGGHGTVEISAATLKNNLIFEVSDDGPGIDPEHKDSVFEAFYTTRKDGNGLGLATCEKITKISGGKIILKSTSEKGTTFQVILPTA